MVVRVECRRASALNMNYTEEAFYDRLQYQLKPYAWHRLHESGLRMAGIRWSSWVFNVFVSERGGSVGR